MKKIAHLHKIKKINKYEMPLAISHKITKITNTILSLVFCIMVHDCYCLVVVMFNVSNIQEKRIFHNKEKKVEYIKFKKIKPSYNCGNYILAGCQN